MNKFCNILIFIFTVCLSSCKNRSNFRELRIGDYFVKGDIKIVNNDTIYNGPIQFFDTSGRVATLVNYKDNLRDGQFIDYYKNGLIDQKANYSQGKENGVAIFYDSSGRINYETNYYFGLEVGPKVSFSNDTFKVYHFTNFEGLDLYRCEWDSSKKIVETGSLLNYVTDYYLDGNDLKLSVFIYLINPPHKRITYKLYDKNIKTNDSTIIYMADSKIGPFDKIYLTPPKVGHKYLINVEAYYPTEKVTIKNITSEGERELKLPHSR